MGISVILEYAYIAIVKLFNEHLLQPLLYVITSLHIASLCQNVPLQYNYSFVEFEKNTEMSFQCYNENNYNNVWLYYTVLNFF